jgi:hypothetical protein
MSEILSFVTKMMSLENIIKWNKPGTERQILQALALVQKLKKLRTQNSDCYRLESTGWRDKGKLDDGNQNQVR